MMFLSDLSRQECSTSTTTSQQEFDVPNSPTGHGEEKGFSQTTDTRRREDTRCVGHEVALLPEYAGKLNTCSHLTEYAEKPEDTSRTSPNAWRTGSNKSRTSQSTQGILHSSKCTRVTDLHCSECAGTNLALRMTQQHREIPQDAQKQKNKGHGSTFLKHVFNTSRDKGQAINHDQNASLAKELTNSTEKETNKRLRSNSDRRVQNTDDGSKTSQTVDVLNIEHKYVAVFREESRPEKVLK